MTKMLFITSLKLQSSSSVVMFTNAQDMCQLLVIICKNV